jgi:GH25 family lysozyme M1 (1,4-beta-N-acetylmuramidase)
MEKKLIDVSKHNGNIDWNKVKAAGIEGAIIRAGYGKFISQRDVCFEKNYTGAKAAGLAVGAYWYSYATDETAAKAEAEAFIEVIGEKAFELPVYLDIEDKVHTKMDMKSCTAIATAFCNTLEDAGYYVGVYSFDSFFSTYLDETIPERFTIWTARVENIKPTYAKTYDIWQHSWKGKIDGISTDVDLNICYKDFPAIMTKHGLNNCKPTQPEPTTTEPTNPEPSKPEPTDDTQTPGTPETEDNTEKYNLSAYKLNLTKNEADALTRTLKVLGMPATVKKAE